MLPAVNNEATGVAREVAGGGGLDGLRRLTAAIAAMETSRTLVIGELRRGPSASWEEIGAACGMTRQGATRRWSRLVHASSFGAAADSYQRGRPQYPQTVVEWLVPRRARSVLDLGAGTGKLTRPLVEAGLLRNHAVIEVDSVPRAAPLDPNALGGRVGDVLDAPGAECARQIVGAIGLADQVDPRVGPDRADVDPVNRRNEVCVLHRGQAGDA